MYRIALLYLLFAFCIFSGCKKKSKIDNIPTSINHTKNIEGYYIVNGSYDFSESHNSGSGTIYDTLFLKAIGDNEISFRYDHLAYDTSYISPINLSFVNLSFDGGWGTYIRLTFINDSTFNYVRNNNYDSYHYYHDVLAGHKIK